MKGQTPKMVALSRKLLALLLALQALLAPAWAQDYSDDDLADLVGPIALYPDPLLSSVMVGVTHPDQVQAAYDYVIGDGHPDVSHQGWDESVKALCSYADVLTMLGESPDYVSGLGWAVTNQPQDVTDAVQRYRYQVKAAGNLNSDDKVNIVEEGVVIRIVPANPEVIYVPTYDPVVVRRPDPVGRALVYGAGVALNVLLWKNVFDWDDRRFYRSPVDWVPPAAYYRPYGWRRDAAWNGSVWRPNRTTVINRPVNINNIQIVQGNGHRYPVRPNRPGIANPNRPQVRPSPRPTVIPGNRPGSRPSNRPGQNTRPSPRPGARPAQPSRPPATNYTTSSTATRESRRGAASRNSGSLPAGGRAGRRNR
jgi:hypothetical protein